MPWDAFNAEVREKVIGGLRQGYRGLARITEYDKETKRMRGQFAQGFSAAGTLGPLRSIARAIELSLPAAPSDQHPGYLTGAQVKLREARAKSRKTG